MNGSQWSFLRVVEAGRIWRKVGQAGGVLDGGRLPGGSPRTGPRPTRGCPLSLPSGGRATFHVQRTHAETFVAVRTLAATFER